MKTSTIISFLLWLIPAYSHAFKIDVHVAIGQELIRDASDGYLTIVKDGEEIELRLNATALIALQQHTNAFYAVTIGPDFYPDILVGQSIIHPGIEHGYMSRDFLFQSLQAAQDHSTKAYAFVLGMLVHAASDTFAHSWVNTYAGDEFNIFDGEIDVEKRHIILEGYLSKLMLSEAKQKSIGDSYPSSSDIPVDFILEQFVKNPIFLEQYDKTLVKHLNLMNSRIGDIEEIDRGTLHMIESYPGYGFIGLGDIKNAVTTVRNELSDWRSGLPNPTSEIKDLYEKVQSLLNAVSGIESSMKEARRDWIIANHQTAKNILTHSSKTAAYVEWLACHSLAFTGIPRSQDVTCKTYNEYMRIVELLSYLGSVSDFLYRQLPNSVRKKIEEVKRFIGRQADRSVHWVLSSEMDVIYELWRKGTTANVLHNQFSRDDSEKGLVIFSDIIERIDHEVGTGKFEPENPMKFNVDGFHITKNALTLSKLAVLRSRRLNQLVGRLLWDESVIDARPMLFDLETLDGNHQWLQQSPALPRRFKEKLVAPKRRNGFRLYQEGGKQLFNSLFSGPLSKNIEDTSDFERINDLNYRYRSCKINPYPNGELDQFCVLIPLM